MADFFVKTPRDVNKTINQLQYELELNNQKMNLSFIKNKLDDIFVVICFIVKNKWQDIYTIIINDRTNRNIKDIVSQYADDLSDINDKIILNNFTNKISNFNITYKDFLIYDNLKTDNAFYDQDIINAIENADIDYLESAKHDSDLIEPFRYVFQKRIVDRNLINDYIENMLIAYTYILSIIEERKYFIETNSPELLILYLKKQLTDTASFSKLILIKQVFIKTFQIKDINIYKYANYIIPLLHEYSPYSLLLTLVENDDLLSNISSENLKTVIQDIITDNMNEENINYANIFNKKDLYPNIIDNNLIEMAIDGNKSMYLSNICNHIKDSFIADRIISNYNRSSLLENIGKRIEELNDKSLNKTVYELNLLTNLLNNTSISNRLELVTKIFNNNIINKIIAKFYQSGTNSDDYNNALSKFIIIYDELSNNNYYNIYYVVQNLQSYNSKIQLLLLMLINIENDLLKYDVLVASLAYSKFNQDLNSFYIDLCNSSSDENVLTLVKEIFNNIKNPITIYNSNFFNKQITIDNIAFNKSLKNRLVELNDIHFIRIMNNYTFDELIRIDYFSNNIKSRSKEVINCFISMCNSIDNYEYCVNLFGKKNRNSLFSSILLKLINNNKNIDFLMKVIEFDLSKKEKSDIKFLIKNDAELANIDTSVLSNIFK